MPPNHYPRTHEREGEQPPFTVFQETFRALDSLPEQTGFINVTLRSLELPADKVIWTRSQTGAYTVYIMLDTIAARPPFTGNERKITICVKSTGQAGQLLLAAYRMNVAQGEPTVEVIRPQQSYTPAEAKFFEAIGIAGIAEKAVQLHPRMPAKGYTAYFPDTAELAGLATLPERTLSYPI